MTASHNAVARVAAGTGTLLRTFSTWLVGDDWRDLLRRLSGTAAAVTFAGMLVSGTRWLMWPGVAWFLLAAWRAAAPAEEPEAEEESDDAERGPALPPLPSLHELSEAVARVGTPHAHISALAEELGITADRVRLALAREGIPVEPVRMRGRASSSTGVKGDHFPASPTTPLGRVVAAGQPANNNDNNTPEVERREGMLIIRDPAETAHRRHTV